MRGTDIRERTTNCTRDRTKMSTAPTTHDTPNENAHRMGAIIKSNRLGSSSKTSASATRMGVPLDPTTENAKATAKVFQNASEKHTQKTKQAE